MQLSSGIHWPDCVATGHWNVEAIAAHDFDGEQGEELLISAHEVNEYPSRISMLDPRRQVILRTFWHWGHIMVVRVVLDFFARGKPAILAFGSNNKLDGFYERQAGDDAPRTIYDIVSVVMILDPAKMDGLGPPRTNRLVDLPSITPYAYAFLDAAVALGHNVFDADNPVHPRSATEDEVAVIESVLVGPFTADDDTGPWFAVTGRRNANNESMTFIVDRHLTFREPIRGRPDAEGEAFWRSRWSRWRKPKRGLLRNWFNHDANGLLLRRNRHAADVTRINNIAVNPQPETAGTGSGPARKARLCQLPAPTAMKPVFGNGT